MIHSGSHSYISSNVLVASNPYVSHAHVLGNCDASLECPCRNTSFTGNALIYSPQELHGHPVVSIPPESITVWDRNVYYSTHGYMEGMKFFHDDIGNWSEWLRNGFDAHSVVSQSDYANETHGQFCVDQLIATTVDFSPRLPRTVCGDVCHNVTSTWSPVRRASASHYHTRNGIPSRKRSSRYQYEPPHIESAAPENMIREASVGMFYVEWFITWFAYFISFISAALAGQEIWIRAKRCSNKRRAKKPVSGPRSEVEMNHRLK